MMDVTIPDSLKEKAENVLDKMNNTILPKVENLTDKAGQTIEEDLKPTLAVIRKYLPLIAIPIFVSFATSVASLVCVIILLLR